MKYVMIPLFILLALQHLAAQSFHVYNLDHSDYPTMRANFVIMDQNDNFVTNLTESDFTVEEDGQSLPVNLLTCPEVKDYQPISSVLTIDNSGSMSSTGLDIAKAAAKEWIRMMPVSKKIECAISSFNGSGFINQDFTKDKTRLNNAVDALSATNGTSFQAALLDENTGALDIVQNGQYKKVIILLTDGQSSCNEQEVIQRANDMDAAIFSVVIGMSAPGVLKNISLNTGGMFFENITTAEEAKAAYRSIFVMSTMSPPCTIEWESDKCETCRSVEISVPSMGLSDELDYKIPLEKISQFEITPSNSIHFPDIKPNKVYDTVVTITAKANDIRINSISSDNPLFSITDYGGSAPPFTLRKNNSRVLTISFTPNDSALKYTKINIESDACIGSNIYANGGYFLNPNDTSGPELTLTHPNGGELFLGGSDTLVTWEGILPSDTVTLEYSIDKGRNWQFITDTASGLEYRWHVPITPSDSCLMKVKYESSMKPKENPIIIKTPARDVNDIALSPDERMIATCGRDSHWNSDASKEIIIWNIYGKKEIKRLKGHNSTVRLIDWSNDGSKIVSKSSDSTIKVWDVETGNVIWSKDFEPTWYNISLEWSPDDKSILTIGQEHKITALDAANGNIIQQFPDDYRAYTAHWSPKGDRILSSAHSRSSGTISYTAIWDFLTESNLVKIKNREENTVIGPMDWSPDDSAIATHFVEGKSRQHEIRVYNSENGNFINSTGVLEVNIDEIAWDPKNRWIAYDYMSRFVKLMDPYTLQVDTTLEWEKVDYHDLGEHIFDITSLEWGKNGNFLAAGGGDSTARIWFFGGGIEMEDQSDSIWAIDVPEAAAKSVFMGEEKVGNMKDSVVEDYVVNTGKFPIRIDTIYFENGDADMFGVVSGMPPYTIDPGDAHDVEFRFAPTSVGAKSSNIIVVTQSGALHENIEGIGVDNELEVLTKMIDFGAVWVGTQKDTVEAVLRNTGRLDFHIDSTVMLGPDKQQFDIINGGGSFDIPAGGNHTMTLAFSPVYAGRTSGQIGFYHSKKGSPEKVDLFGEGLIPRTVVWMPDTTVEPGTDDFIIELKGALPYDKEISLTALSYNAEIELDGTAFLAEQPAGTITTDGSGNKKLTVSLSGSSIDMANETATIGAISGTVLLGEQKTSPLKIKSFNWGRNDIETDTIHGSLTLTTCVYDLRKVNTFTRTQMNIQPNPISKNAEIEIVSESEGAYKLKLYNIHGRLLEKVQWQSVGEKSTRLINIDFKKYRAGYYQLLLEAPWEVVSKPVMIVK